MRIDHRQTADIILEHFRHGVENALVGIGDHKRARAGIEHAHFAFRIRLQRAQQIALRDEALQAPGGIHDGQRVVARSFQIAVCKAVGDFADAFFRQDRGDVAGHDVVDLELLERVAFRNPDPVPKPMRASFSVMIEFGI